ncbi:unnamed protein product [Psylliodes chrysocephalus]|uniref:DNA-directed DNA polymerase n=1 Tax=Psylliodes chrysocephalus TaxID=3402493 RepID=A0A9P0CVG0_9CUCU|nr:unnamed protein product [Psylliodes chrysocephala]
MVLLKFPKVINLVEFKNFKNKERVPFIVYADLESVLNPMENKNIYQQHVPAAVDSYLKCSYDDTISFYRSYKGSDYMQWFTDEMKKLAEDLETLFWCPLHIDISAEQEYDFQKSTYCHICEQPFEHDDKKVRDHFHLLPYNNCRGPFHKGCNINYQDSHVVPVVFHNLSGYDAHFVIIDIATRLPCRVDLLPITKDKYISFTKHIKDSPIQFRFIDSFRFMNSGLSTLAPYLENFPNLRSQFAKLSEDHYKWFRSSTLLYPT